METPSSTTSTAASTTPTTTTSTAPPAPPADAADLKPLPVDGKSVIVADTSSKDYKEFKIKAGITNTGKTPAASVSVSLYNTGNKIYTWNISTVAVGENVILETTVGEILKQSTFTPGLKSLSIDISVANSSQEIGGNNKSAAQDITIAPPPAARRASQSSTEKMIQDSIDNSTWYTSANQKDLITIAKDALKNASVQWSQAQIEIMSFDDFNKLYSDTYGESDQQKKEIKTWLEKNRLVGVGFVWGTTVGAKVCLREGTLIQLLPAMFYNLGEITYAQANYGAYRSGAESGSVALLETLLETYGFSILRDNYGFSGLTNISSSVGSIPNLNLKNDQTLKRLWSVTGAAGYLNGNVPSADLLKVYSTYLMKPDPVTYMKELDKQVVSLEVSLIENTINWRMVNKDAVMLTKDTVTKIDPTETSLSLDTLIAYQDFVSLPW